MEAKRVTINAIISSISRWKTAPEENIATDPITIPIDIPLR